MKDPIADPPSTQTPQAHPSDAQAQASTSAAPMQVEQEEEEDTLSQQNIPETIEEELDDGPWGLDDYGIPRPSRSIKPNPAVEVRVFVSRSRMPGMDALRCEADLKTFVSHAQAKLRHFHALRQQNVHFNATLQANKSFRNPSILSKLVDFVAVDDKLAGFPREVWTSSAGLGPDAWASAIGMDYEQSQPYDEDKSMGPG